MRVTNAMISNNMMLGLNKNMNRLNTLYDQVTTLKKIQRPSDDPIILGRSLKLRLNVLETEQYKTNVGEARSWMDVSEASINNTHEIFDNIRKEYVQAANGPLGVDDREKIMETVKQLKNQLIQEANANYAGRNVFSGYKTDQKVLFDKDQKMADPVKFEQTFDKNNVETVTYRSGVGGGGYSRIRLPYGDIDGNIIVGEAPNTTTVIGVDSIDTPVNGVSHYQPDPDDVYFIKDTGELILGENVAKNMTDMKVSYEKTNFKAGDPNPDVFFNTDGGNPPTYTDDKDPQRIEYEIGIGTKMDINVLGKNLFDPLSLRDIDEMIHILETYEENPNNPADKVNLSDLFSGGIGKMDKALSNVSTQQADLGSRMARLELTKKRLGDDEITYKELLSNTEDVELDRVYMEFNVQYAVYQSALQVTAKVVQPTLMDFLR